MSRGICAGCGEDSHIDLALQTDGVVAGFIGTPVYCPSCGSFVAGVLKSIHRDVFKRALIDAVTEPK
jgi:hypothetical protein